MVVEKGKRIRFDKQLGSLLMIWSLANQISVNQTPTVSNNFYLCTWQ